MLCYCAGACPASAVNNTCRAPADAWCFAAVQQAYDARSNQYFPERTYGCLQPAETGYMQCKSTNVPFEVPATIECCRDGDHCNRHLKPMYEVRDEHLTSQYLGYDDTVPQMALLVSITLCLLIFVLAVAVFYFRYRKRLDSRSDRQDSIPDYETLLTAHHALTEASSGSGSGKPFLAQRTIAREVAVFEVVGQGRYGLVRRGLYHAQPVAVKVFYSPEEAAWTREKAVYESCRLQHPNVLGFIAADITSGGGLGADRSCTEMWLITEYHAHGSLHDYLKQHVQSPADTLRMCLSIIQGLDYLHKEVVATSIRPAIAHRDIKSKNILVKQDGQCCIADFGLAVMYTSVGEKQHLDVVSTRQGTRRYMSPEVLSDTLNKTNFEAYKQSDIYSVALVFWELGLRCATGDKQHEYEEYTVPYSGLVPADPGFDDMHALVCVQGARPHLPDRWSQHKVLRTLSRLMKDCWRGVPAARLRALNVKKHLTAALAAERTHKPPLVVHL